MKRVTHADNVLGLLQPSSLFWSCSPCPTKPTRKRPTPALTRDRASAFARLALKGLNKEYPNKPEHVMDGPADVKGPQALHPAFFGCFDWHSSVHGHWMLVRLLRVFPDLPERAEIRAILGTHLTAENLQAEADYFAAQREQVLRAALRLGVAAEAGGGAPRLGRPRREGLGTEPQAARRRDRRAVPRVLSRSKRIRSAPACTRTRRSGSRSPMTTPGPSGQALDRADRGAGAGLLRHGRRRSGEWEPGGADFFSPTLTEADLMRRVLPPDEFRAWFSQVSARGCQRASRKRCSRPPR